MRYKKLALVVSVLSILSIPAYLITHQHPAPTQTGNTQPHTSIMVTKEDSMPVDQTPTNQPASDNVDTPAPPVDSPPIDNDTPESTPAPATTPSPEPTPVPPTNPYPSQDGNTTAVVAP